MACSGACSLGTHRAADSCACVLDADAGADANDDTDGAMPCNGACLIGTHRATDSCACVADTDAGADAGDPDAIPVLQGDQPLGSVHIWLASSVEIPQSIGNDGAQLVDIDGTVTAVKAGDLKSPTNWPPTLGDYASEPPVARVLAIHANSGVDWQLGWKVEGPVRSSDLTPAAPVAVGDVVHLRFRAIYSFGRAAAFVVSDARGTLLAIDDAVWGDPLKPDDVLGLTVTEGRTVATSIGSCFDERHTGLVFTGDTPVDVAPGQTGELSLKGIPSIAFTLYNVVAIKSHQCSDAVGTARIWALWRKP